MRAYEVSVSEDGEVATLKIESEIVYHVNDGVWAEWRDARGNSDLRLPRFCSLRCDLEVAMRAGRIMMLAAYSPMTPAGVSDPARKVMVFGRCDILHFGPHPRPLQPEVPEATEDSDPFAAGGVDPFAQDDRAGEPRDSALLRLLLEFIEVPQARYAAWVAPVGSGVDDDKLRKEVGHLLETGEALRVGAMCAAGSAGRGVIAKSVREIRYPSSWEPGQVPRLIETGTTGVPSPEQLAKLATAPFPSLWERREVGASFKAELTTDDDATVRSGLHTRLVRHTGDDEWLAWRDARGDNSLRTAVFHMIELNGQMRTPHGHFLLVAAFSACGADGINDPSRKVLVFAKAEILTIHKQSKPPARPALVRTRMEFIEASGKQADELLAEVGRVSDGELRRVLLEKADRGDAKILETAAVACPSHERVSARSGKEFIHPNEFLEPEMPAKSGTAPDAPEPNGPVAISWDTTFLGFALDAGPGYRDDTGLIELSVSAGQTSHAGDHTWYHWPSKYGDSNVRVPGFETQNYEGNFDVAPGEPQLVSVLTPFDANGNLDHSRRIFVFVRCDPIGPGG